jgi:hypothetical protein
MTRSRRHSFAPVTLALVAAAASPLALSARGPVAGAPALVVAAPWTDPETVTRAAGGNVVAPRRAPMATIAVFADAEAIAAARAAGAWLVLDGAALASLCGVI